MLHLLLAYWNGIRTFLVCCRQIYICTYNLTDHFPAATNQPLQIIIHHSLKHQSHKMVQLLSLLTPFIALAGFVAAAPTGKGAEPIVTYLGSQGPILSGGAWTSKGIVFTAGTVPSKNGTIVAGGIEEQTVRSFAFISENQILTSPRHKSSPTSA